MFMMSVIIICMALLAWGIFWSIFEGKRNYLLNNIRKYLIIPFFIAIALFVCFMVGINERQDHQINYLMRETNSLRKELSASLMKKEVGFSDNFSNFIGKSESQKKY